jgi:Uma2 family endonuclease
MVFVDGRLSFLVTSREHDWFVDCLGDIVKVGSLACGIACEPAGQATFRRADMEVGVEGDRAFYLGDSAQAMRGPVNVDLSVQPPPDLAIEVEVTHPADDALLAWGRIGVPEVWRLNVAEGSFAFCQRLADGSYRNADRSSRLPGLTTEEVLAQLRQAEALGWSRWFAQLGDWAREVLQTAARDPRER